MPGIIHKKIKVISAFVVLALLSGCEAAVETRNTQRIKDELAYFKDDYGNCFASIGSLTSNSLVTISIAAIPCENMPKHPAMKKGAKPN
jgi:hypothetical protein